MTPDQLAELIEVYAAEQRHAEVVWFYEAVDKIKPKIIVEIGNKEGGNLKILSTHLDEGGLVIGIDPFRNREKELVWKMDDCICEAKHILGDSHFQTTLEELKRVLNGRPIDVLFIDGDHHTGGMILDYVMYGPLVREGGIIAVHDIYYLEPVKRAWEEVSRNKEKFESEYNQSSIGIGYFLKGKD